MKTEKIIGYLLIAGAIGVLVPYTLLTITFGYPDILRKDPSVILTKFHEGGSPLILTWLAFAVMGLPLLIAYVMIGQQLEKKSIHVKWATVLGIISGMVQIIGLLRWVFVVPVIADSYIHIGNENVKEAAIIAFKVVHQFGGVLLGEFIGQLFTIIWTIIISIVLLKSAYFPKWVCWLGIISAVIYFMAQAELLATVIPGFPYWGAAGFIGSTLWLLWLIISGIFFIRKREEY
jgi:hypothetical protein